MFKNPKALFGYSLGLLWRLILQGRMQRVARPQGQEDSKAWELLEAFHTFLRDTALEMADEGVNPNNVPPFFERRVSAWFLGRAEEIRKKSPAFLCEVHRAAEWCQVFAPEAPWPTIMVATLHVLYGEERKLLVGARDNKAAFKSLTHPLTTREAIDTLFKHFPGGSEMRLIGQDDIFLVPEPHEASTVGFMDDVFPKVRSLDPITDILTDAYYNQYYVPHPAGAYVKLHSGTTPFRAITLKVRTCQRDRNYHDFLARLSLDDGDMFVSLEGLVATGQRAVLEEVQGQSIPWGFPKLVIAQIYHDLVTVRHLPEQKRGERPKTDPVDRKPREGDPAYRYIPRVVQIGREGQTVRQAIPVPRVSDPHFVSGHPRVGNMSEEQRRNILDFEAETGFKVLENLPPGKTWVRPHMSPTADSATVQSLPKFIRARIQADLTRKLRGE